MAIKNIIAQGIGFSPGSVKYIPTLGFDVPSTVWDTHETWLPLRDGNTRELMVLMKATAGTAYARLYDKTNAAAVTGSEVSTTDTSMTLHQTGALSLTEGNEYQIQGGKSSGGGYEIWNAQVIEL